MNEIGFDLTGKVAMITGPGRGIGRTIAEQYAKKGDDIILLGQGNNILQTEKAVLKNGVKALSLIYDITKPENIGEIITKSINRFGRIDILVNNAGVVFPDKAEDLSKTNWDQTISTNLTAPFLLSQAAGR